MNHSQRVLFEVNTNGRIIKPKRAKTGRKKKLGRPKKTKKSRNQLLKYLNNKEYRLKVLGAETVGNIQRETKKFRL